MSVPLVPFVFCALLPTPMNAPAGRKSGLHGTPTWLDPAESDYFVMICCQRRGDNQFCLPAAAEILLQAAKFYHQMQRWHLPLLVLMPDHLHMLVSFGREKRMEDVVKAWKSFTAKKAGIRWQRDFFEHRLRSNESADEKMEYIRQNPVRQGLAAKPEDWPYLLTLQ